MMQRISVHFFVVTALIAGLSAGLSGCGSDDKPAGKTPADTGVEQDAGAGSIDTIATDTATDSVSTDTSTTTTTDLGAADVSGCPGGAGCACKGNADCDQSMCLDTAQGAKCAKSCTDEKSCDAGQSCASVKAAGGDEVSICVDTAVRLCNPCKTNAACGGPGTKDARCVSRGEAGNFCGIACAADAGCPSGTTCRDVTDVAGKAVKQCMPAKDVACTCSPLAIEKELSTTCGVGGSDAVNCAGVRACLAAGKEGAPTAGGLSTCQGGKPAQETCSNTDDDCDGQTDEGADCDDKDACTTDACQAGKCVYTKTTGTCDDGDACTEADTCATGACVGKTKACDDGSGCTDDSCDKLKGCVNAAKKDGGSCDDADACTSADVCAAGVCAGKKKGCNDGNSCTLDSCDAKTGKCASTVNVGSCDDGDPCTVGDICGKDTGSGQTTCLAGKVKSCDDSNPCTTDSCDKVKGCGSVVDIKQTQPCYTKDPNTKGVGACKSGVQTCLASGGFGACVGEIGPATKETCNGKDDTCNGTTDEKCVGGGPPQLVWRFGTAVVEGSNAKGMAARMFVGGSAVAGRLDGGQKTSLELGFYAWLSAWIK